MSFNEALVKREGKTNGVSAMSISDMTGIPRATVTRKCKFLTKYNLLELNDKKQYILTHFTLKKIIPHQKKFFKFKAKFIRKVLNLCLIS
jgi:hypothetical protein